MLLQDQESELNKHRSQTRLLCVISDIFLSVYDITQCKCRLLKYFKTYDLIDDEFRTNLTVSCFVFFM